VVVSTLVVEAALPAALVAVALARAAVLLLLAGGVMLTAAAVARFHPLLLPPYLGQFGYCLLSRLLLLQLLEPLLLRPPGMSPTRHPLPVLSSTPTHLSHQWCPVVLPSKQANSSSSLTAVPTAATSQDVVFPTLQGRGGLSTRLTTPLPPLRLFPWCSLEARGSAKAATTPTTLRSTTPCSGASIALVSLG